jgi:hypothetical protein
MQSRWPLLDGIKNGSSSRIEEVVSMDEAEIQQRFARAGWELDGSFYEHLTIGYTEDLSILAYRRAWETEDLQFQLCDHENDLSCWVREIPTPSVLPSCFRSTASQQ